MTKEINAVFPCADWFFVSGPPAHPAVQRIAAWGKMQDGSLVGLLPGSPAARPVLALPDAYTKGTYKHRDDLTDTERSQVKSA